MTVITETNALNDICETLSHEPYIMLDTEFLRDKTYYAKLCLIQLGGKDINVAIDPLSPDIDLSAFYDLMRNESVLKVLHAGRQDLEIFYQQEGVIPAPLFDTQIAGMVCGFGDQVGYEALVKQITGHQINKSNQFTDWSQRPLSNAQLEYALNDVIYLRPVYEHLRDYLDKNDRKHWVEEELAALTSTDTYEIDMDGLWQRIKIRNKDPETLAILQKLAAWRETLAQERNVPKGRIIRDDVLSSIAMLKPRNRDKLQKIRGFPPQLMKQADHILQTIQDGRAVPPQERPRAPERLDIPPHCEAVIEMLKMLLKIRCATHKIVPRIVASQEDVQRLGIGDQANIPAQKGWRYEVFGRDALKLKHGEIALAVHDGEIIEIDSPLNK